MISEAAKFLVLLVIGAVAALVLLAGCVLRLLTGAAMVVAGIAVCGHGACEPAAVLLRLVFGG